MGRAGHRLVSFLLLVCLAAGMLCPSGCEFLYEVIEDECGQKGCTV